LLFSSQFKSASLNLDLSPGSVSPTNFKFEIWNLRFKV